MSISRPLTLAWVLLISACYQQPVISPQRPLRCTPSLTVSECPKGFNCVATGICAANSCQEDNDCPAGLACSSRGCVLVPDGGAGDAGAIQIPVVPDGGSPDVADPSSLDAAPSSPDLTFAGGNG